MKDWSNNFNFHASVEHNPDIWDILSDNRYLLFWCVDFAYNKIMNNEEIDEKIDDLIENTDYVP